MLCDQVREHLSAYLDKELTAELTAAVRSHLDSCAECRMLLEDLRATADLLGRLPVHAAPEHVAQDVQREIERRALVGGAPPDEGQPRERTLPIRRARLWPRALAVAATVALATGIGILAYLTQTQEAPVAVDFTSPLVRPESPTTSLAYLANRARPGEADEKKAAGPADKFGGVPATPTKAAARGRLAESLDGPNGIALRMHGAADLKRHEKDARPSQGDDLSVARGPAAAPAETEGVAKGTQDYSYKLPAAPARATPERAETRKDASEGAAKRKISKVDSHFADIAGTTHAETRQRGQALGELAPKPDTPAPETWRAGQAPAVQTPAPPPAPPAEPAPPATGWHMAGKSAAWKPEAAKPAAPPATPAAAEKSPASAAPAPLAIATAPAAQPSMAARLVPLETAARSSIIAGPPAVQRMMVSVVNGAAALDDLKAIATRDNLSSAEYQLVLVADSRRAGDQTLQQLFQANGWQAVTADRADAYGAAMKRPAEGVVAGEDSGWRRSGIGGGAGGRKALPPGLYYAAPDGGEDTWVVVTDRDSLSRFAGQLAQTEDLTVSTDSSGPFRPVRDLQKELRRAAPAREERAAEATPLSTERLKQIVERADPEGYTLAKVEPRQAKEGEADEPRGEKARDYRATTPAGATTAGAVATPPGKDEIPPVRLGISAGKPASPGTPSEAQAQQAAGRRLDDADKGETARFAGNFGVAGRRLDEADKGTGLTRGGEDLHRRDNAADRQGGAEDRVLVVIRVRQAAAANVTRDSKPADAEKK